MELTCKRCGKGWNSVVATPKQCRWCHSPYWNLDKVRAGSAEKPDGVAMDDVVGPALIPEPIVPVERELTPMELRAQRIAAFGNKKPVMPGGVAEWRVSNDFGDAVAKEEDVSQIPGRGRKRK